jgi:hypothetical protein
MPAVRGFTSSPPHGHALAKNSLTQLSNRSFIYCLVLPREVLSAALRPSYHKQCFQCPIRALVAYTLTPPSARYKHARVDILNRKHTCPPYKNTSLSNIDHHNHRIVFTLQTEFLHEIIAKSRMETNPILSLHSVRGRSCAAPIASLLHD